MVVVLSIKYDAYVGCYTVLTWWLWDCQWNMMGMWTVTQSKLGGCETVSEIWWVCRLLHSRNMVVVGLSVGFETCDRLLSLHVWLASLKLDTYKASAWNHSSNHLPAHNLKLFHCGLDSNDLMLYHSVLNSNDLIKSQVSTCHIICFNWWFTYF